MSTVPSPFATDRIAQHDTTGRIDVICVDMNGIARGKWVPATELDAVLNAKVRMPLSTQSLDIWGEDNDHLTALSQSTGDPDGICHADKRTHVPLPWAHGSQILTTLHTVDGAPSFMDPRAILRSVIERFSHHGWTPVVALELEFYLLDGSYERGLRPAPPAALCPGGIPKGLQLYELDSMEPLNDVLENIRAHAEVQDIPTDTLIAEFGAGQYEVNLLHRADALAAADDAFCFKRIVTHTARQHGLASTFMAKPYSDHTGSGLHLHVSVIDETGRNILDPDNGDDHLEAAIGGVMHSMLDAQAVFAPHANSYRRFQPDSFAPTACNWGWDHRGTAVRIPERHGPNTRLEHRVAGADANPYLVAATLLGGMLQGLEQRMEPPPAINDSHATPVAPDYLTHDWLTAIERFGASSAMADIVGTAYRDLYTTIKRHEAQQMLAKVTDVDYETYLTRL